MNSGIILQARLGSKRFPGKTCKNINGQPMIWHVINRLKQVKQVSQIILATTKEKQDKILLDIASNEKIKRFSGSSDNVLERYYQCAKKFSIDPIIRITGDCPLIESQLIDEMAIFFHKNNYDYVSNTLEPTFPDGLDVEIISFKTLKILNEKSKLKSEREHVTSYIKKHKSEFRIFNFKNNEDLSNFRWTVDEKEDLEFIRKIYSLNNLKPNFNMYDVLKNISENPELLQINKNIKRNEGYYKSLQNDHEIN